MKKTIERLKQKPKKERQRYALSGAFIITLLITLIWLSVVRNRFDGSPQTAQVQGPIESILSSIFN